jgi:hypothetical protein
LARSEAVLTHDELHGVRPPVHAHDPDEHDRPEGHTVPHEPQLFGSLPSVTQLPLQSVVPGAHVVVQVPPTQT